MNAPCRPTAPIAADPAGMERMIAFNLGQA